MSTLLKNSDGAILKNAEGSLLKQNFNFGNAFSNPLGEDSYLDLGPLFNMTDTFTILGWVKKGDQALRPLFLFRTDGDKCPLGLILSATVEAKYISPWTSSSNNSYYSANNTQLGLASIEPETMIGFTLNPSGANNMRILAQDKGRSESTQTIQYSGETITNLYLGVAPRFGLQYTGGMDEVLIFNREISLTEQKYIYNNGLGNLPLSETGLIAHLKNSLAELIDFSAAQDGSDIQVAVRDISGQDNHAKITNLPAGTNQEKVDYANANLFTSW